MPPIMGHSVAIVVDTDFGKSLASIAQRVHVWLCRSPSNTAAAEAYRSADPEQSLERGVTTFSVQEHETPEDMLLSVLGDVDLHHGEHSHPPPWDTLEIFGVGPTASVRAALADYGVNAFDTTPYGFKCSRSSLGAA